MTSRSLFPGSSTAAGLFAVGPPLRGRRRRMRSGGLAGVALAVAALAAATAPAPAAAVDASAFAVAIDCIGGADKHVPVGLFEQPVVGSDPGGVAVSRAFAGTSCEGPATRAAAVSANRLAMGVAVTADDGGLGSQDF